ncbi:protein DMR6-LIKE OXYGENASE 2-like [Cucumis melo var. makuwa]|uniref:Protein DMR6-LIKE OXYGENASE 2-like n=1 Tax=Cucumis melo var. makuwa TaxID=1194695 RepID=A0A5A7SKK1_CUCMM|nr:protein DMR6-LIKE OXYGENASE 2-like [Cucumis melo var. makuwa]
MGDLEDFDHAFIQAPEHRPKLALSDADGIPTIDLSPIFNSVPGTDFPHHLVQQIASACTEWGFFLVVNHGVPPEKRRRIEAAAREFFGQSLEEKRKVRRNEWVVTGYFDTELTKNVRDWKEVFDFVVEDPTVIPASSDPDDTELTQLVNQWPEYPPEFGREICEGYVEELEKLGHKLMELIANSLGLPGKRFRDYFKGQTSSVRLNHYPLCPSPELALGVGRHKDPGVLTVLAQDDIGGLEVRRKRDGAWIQVKPVPDSFVVNVGDITQVWSNEKYESVEHRATVNSKRDRYSIAFFFYPSHSTIVEPLEELIGPQNPPKYKPYSFGKFLASRKRSNFKKLNVDNIQISDFKITT